MIANAVDPAEFRFGAEPDAGLRTELGLDGKTVLGFAGSFYAYEGLDLLLEAAALLAPRHPELRVLLVGGGPQESALRERANATDLAGHVIFAGRVPHDRVQRYYELIDVLAYPRRRIPFTEVTPLKPLEAMAQGRMFVASDVVATASSFATARPASCFPLVIPVRWRVPSNPSSTSATSGRGCRPRRDVTSRPNAWTRSVAHYVDVYASLSAARDGCAPSALGRR